jgi:hypothetical protein
MEDNSKYICIFCNNEFKTEDYIKKHQKTSKYCMNIQKVNLQKQNDELIIKLKNTNKELEDEIQKKNILIKSVKQELDNEIQKLINENNNKLEIQNEFKKKIDDKNYKYKTQLEYNSDLDSSIKKLREEKIRIELDIKKTIEENNGKLQTELTNKQLLEKKINEKINIDFNLQKIIEDYNKYLQKEIELKIENMVKQINDEINKERQSNNIGIDKIQKEIIDIPNNTIYDEKLTNNTIEDCSISNNYPELISNVLNHLELFLNENKIGSNNILYITIELMKFVDNFYIKNMDKKQIITYVLKSFINNQKTIIQDSEHINVFVNKYLSDFIDIGISIAGKKLQIKNKKSCFFPICC